ncbi:MAG: tetrathionate reductase family octaheme c-type cytochrome [Desulfurivibrionaceae bacterium]|nr:tetrathionate reductase family octaheme c-type cytochrome [Desulfurivibrionaceae bacterium]
MKKCMIVSAAAWALLAGASLVSANEDHKSITGPFATPMDVTKKCLECHEDAAKEVMGTSHWTWELEQEIDGKMVKRGKRNVLNNFCISIKSNWERCTSCHVGYGWKDASFDFSDESRVDCLVCHDTSGEYKKAAGAPAGAGMPPGYTGKKKYDKNPVDLVKVAQNVGTPQRDDCLACHANGGGGNNVKHGDIDMSLLNPDKDIDIHMAVEGNNFSCQECHQTSEHKIAGNSLIVSPMGTTPVNCENCHDGEHKSGIINKHTASVACQTCHIPTFAKKYATKMSWDWSKAEQGKAVEKDEDGHKVYIPKKGRFTYEQNVTPEYRWYNGTAGVYQLGDKIDPSQVTKLNYPLGDINDKNAKIMPFKVHTGKQIYDAKNNYLITPKVFGFKGDPEAFWVNFDWDKAAEAGMRASGLEYSGEYGFTATETYWSINHMVTAKSDALKCNDCHGSEGRLDWQALGYKGDPRKVKGAARK